LGFESLPELKSAHEVVKKIFSLEFSPKAEVINKVVDDLITKVQDHALDVQSLEINIAKDTVAIRNGIQHCLQFRKDKVSKARLIERIHKRKCRLKQLRQRDIDKFNWIISELQLQLLPDPTPERMTLSRREKREKAAREATEALIRQKTEDLRKRLAVEKAAFDKYRELELANIEHSLREIGIGEMVSFEQTLTALGMPELVPKPEPKLTWEERMKIKKMEQLCKKKKEIDAEILRSHGFIVPRTLLS
jgi:ribosomal protein S15P/S13E